jgi:AcrR family transcriptional regulator
MSAQALLKPTPENPDDNAKRRQIVQGARAMFLERGFDAASMSDIARKAGVSKGTLYVYFDSKEQLFEALIREGKKEQAERLVFPGEPGDARELLGGFGRRLIELMTRPENIAYVRIVIAATAKFPRLGQAFYEAGPCHGRGNLAAQLVKLCDAGALEIEDTERAAQQFIDLCKSGVLNPVLFGVTETVDPREIEVAVDAAVEVFMRAYGAKRSV